MQPELQNFHLQNIVELPFSIDSVLGRVTVHHADIIAVRCRDESNNLGIIAINSFSKYLRNISSDLIYTGFQDLGLILYGYIVIRVFSVNELLAYRTPFLLLCPAALAFTGGIDFVNRIRVNILFELSGSPTSTKPLLCSTVTNAETSVPSRR